MERSVLLDLFKIRKRCSSPCRPLPAPMSGVQRGHPAAANLHFLSWLNINKPCPTGGERRSGRGAQPCTGTGCASEGVSGCTGLGGTLQILSQTSSHHWALIAAQDVYPIVRTCTLYLKRCKQQTEEQSEENAHGWKCLIH